ncbi:IS66 family insertion sequence element accessory protein TnpB, partial [Vibrio sp. 1262-1]|uniref:IS66 family insertion sequence element accessory protein TnpB n=1 Tax=Vibrio sp. 1262-1 TaxID=3074548 RepID=UPI00398D18C9
LCYDGSGYWLMSMRLTKGRLQVWPRKSQETITPLVARQLKALRTGLPGWQRV